MLSLSPFTVPIHSNPEVDLESQTNSLDRFIPPYKLSDSGNGANGFMLVVDDGEMESLSHKMRVSVVSHLCVMCLYVNYCVVRLQPIYLTH